MEPLQLGEYQLIRRLATGGMAELFLARALSRQAPQHPVVLKRILPQHAESEDFIRMFLTEARLAVNLHHANIVEVRDIGEDEGQYFFTMEYVQGQDLRRFVRRARKLQRPIPLELILHVIIGVAAGLHHAHDQTGEDGEPLGIVHRDVSPSNVLVTYGGDIKIVDFGIAKAATAQVATIAGTLKGKIPYMSPEQCRGESVDRRSDIFTIGTLLWELTTGRRLFAGDNEFAILNRVAKGDVPAPSSIRPDYPPELEAIVMRALQPHPRYRYATAQELERDLADFAREARLPLSSARMAQFMRELFSEEIQESSAEVLLIEQGELPTVRRSHRTTRETLDYTPSGLRPESVPTPGLGFRDTEGSSTHISGNSKFELEVPRRRVSAWALGGLITLSVTGWGLMTLMSSSPTSTPTRSSIEVRSVPEPADGVDVAAPVQVAAPMIIIEDETPPPPEALVKSEEGPQEEDEALLIEEDEPKEVKKAPARATERRSSRTTRRRPRAHRQHDRRSVKKKPAPRKPEPEAPTKPKWDPDAPLPPGF